MKNMGRSIDKPSPDSNKEVPPVSDGVDETVDGYLKGLPESEEDPLSFEVTVEPVEPEKLAEKTRQAVNKPLSEDNIAKDGGVLPEPQANEAVLDLGDKMRPLFLAEKLANGSDIQDDEGEIIELTEVVEDGEGEEDEDEVVTVSSEPIADSEPAVSSEPVTDSEPAVSSEPVADSELVEPVEPAEDDVVETSRGTSPDDETRENALNTEQSGQEDVKAEGAFEEDADPEASEEEMAELEKFIITSTDVNLSIKGLAEHPAPADTNSDTAKGAPEGPHPVENEVQLNGASEEMRKATEETVKKLKKQLPTIGGELVSYTISEDSVLAVIRITDEKTEEESKAMLADLREKGEPIEPIQILKNGTYHTLIKGEAGLFILGGKYANRLNAVEESKNITNATEFFSRNAEIKDQFKDKK